MKIDVYGAIFYDIYIYGNKPHESQMIEVPGGSGFNIAYLLHKLGHIGNDFKGDFLKKIIPFENIELKEGKTAIFISKNDIPVGVERRINDSVFANLNKTSEIAIITTEISRNEIKRIEKLNYDQVFFDIGPRPYISKNLFKDAFVIGTHEECKFRKCDIFDGFFIHYRLNNFSIEDAIKKSIEKVEQVLDIPTAYNKINALF
ncbi:MAG: hypothetical protein B6I29_01320 [Marinitoga sp. 4572_148]|nr:MAG: hypothetical protein B6I29_01320 [Marinitoga sp. 4572_148]